MQSALYNNLIKSLTFKYIFYHYVLTLTGVINITFKVINVLNYNFITNVQLQM